MSPTSRRRLAGYLTAALVLLGLWELAARFGPYATVVPGPGELIRQMWSDRGLYDADVKVTLNEAAQGYVWGNLLAIGAAFATSRYQALQRLAERFTVTAIALPLVAVAPLLAIMFSGGTPSVILAAQSVVFTTLVAVLLGQRSVAASSVDVIRAAGGSEWTILRRGRIPASLPYLIGGLQVAAPSAILGAIIGEYLGSSSGLGAAMIAAQGSFEVARLWGLLLVTSVMAAAFYVAIPMVARLFIPSLRSVETSLGATERRVAIRGGRRRVVSALVNLVLTVVVIIGIWWLVALIPGASSITRAPNQVIPYLIHGQTTLNATGAGTSSAIDFMLQQLLRTLSDTALGVIFGTALAVVVSVVAFEFKSVEGIVLGFSVALRSVPILAVIPLLALIFGRGLVAVTVLIGLMTFFPTVVNMLMGMRAIPRTAEDIFRAAGASRWETIRRLRLLYAMPGLLASVKIAVPVSIGAAMVAEWLSTGDGLGASLTVAAAVYDYDFIWGAVFLILLTSLAAYHLAAAAESKLIERRS